MQVYGSALLLVLAAASATGTSLRSELLGSGALRGTIADSLQAGSDRYCVVGLQCRDGEFCYKGNPLLGVCRLKGGDGDECNLWYSKFEKKISCAKGLACVNDGYFDKGICKPEKVKVGDPCEEDIQCSSGECARNHPGGPTVCCTGQSISYWGYYYCRGRPALTKCWTDSVCESNNCKGGVCSGTPKTAAGGACNSNSDCASGDCSRTTRDGDLQCCARGSYYCYAWTSGNCKSTFYYCRGFLGH